MANEQNLKNLYAVLDKFDQVDVEKLLRKEIGTESLESAFRPYLDEINRLRKFVKEYAPRVHDEHVNQARSMFENILGQLNSQAARPSADYIAQRDSFVNQVKAYLEEAKRWEIFFIGAAIEVRGFLQDEGIREEYRQAVQTLKDQSAETLGHVQAESKKALEEAKTLAEQIEARARRTASGISMAEAQRQFNEASTVLEGKVKVWRQASMGATLLLVLAAAAFAWWPLPSGSDWTVGLYHTLIRIFVLSAVGAVSAFTFRMLRAHMHMAEKNLHRVRVANSAESFVNAALEPQQRDLLLAKIAETIIDFGDSGIIKGEGEHDSGVLSADLLGRILAAVTTKK